GHPGYAHPEGDLPGPFARLRRSAANPADFERAAGDSTGFLISRALPSGTPGVDQKGMGGIGEQSAGAQLPADRCRQGAAAVGSRSLEPDVGGGCRHFEDNPGGTMSLWSRFRSCTTAMLRRSHMERDMDEEMRFHIDARAADLVSRGVPRQEALRQARLDFGGLETTKEECRDAVGVSFMETVLQD